MKKTTLILVIFLLSIAVVLAQESHDSEIEEGKKLVESKISCNKLSNEQLEAIGEYYMEQMHPGEAHEIMDNMMGGEGSESLRQVHINIAKRSYCGENIGMMGGGMIENNYQNNYFGFQMFFYIILTLVIIVLVLIIILLINKAKQKERKTK